MAVSKEVIDVCLAYTGNKMTLAQAVHCLKVCLSDVMTPSQLQLKELLNILGHKQHVDDTNAIEHGYEGSMQKWLEAGHRPYGWSQLFRDNYKFYTEESCIPRTTEPETKMIAAVTSRPHCVANVEE